LNLFNYIIILAYIIFVVSYVIFNIFIQIILWIKTFITKFNQSVNLNGVCNKDFKAKSNKKTVNKLNNIHSPLLYGRRKFSSSSNYTSDNKEISLIDNKPKNSGNDNEGKDNWVVNRWHHFRVDFFLSPDLFFLTEGKLTDNSIEFVLIQFFDNILSKLASDQYVLILFRVIYLDGSIFTLGEAQRICNKDFKKIFELYKELMFYKDDQYKSMTVNYFVVSFLIQDRDEFKMSMNTQTSLIRDYRIDGQKNSVTWNKLFNTSLPNTADFNLWGDIYLTKTDKNGLTIHHIRKNDSNSIFVVKVLSTTETEVKVMFKNKIILKFNDELKLVVKRDYEASNVHKRTIDQLLIQRFDRSSFTRVITNNNQKFFYINGLIIFKSVIKKTNFLKAIKVSKNNIFNIITMDIETRNIDNILVPYAVCFYDGSNEFEFYLDNYNSPEEMLKDALLNLLQAKYNKFRVYFHNLSYFDAVDFLRILASLDNTHLKPQLKDGKIINLRLNYGKNYNLFFRDSFLLLPHSLDSLATIKAMNVEHKGTFPLFFAGTKGTLDLNFVGNCPEYKYFKKNLEIVEFVRYLVQFVHVDWSLKDETLKYCMQDCKSLYQVLYTFNELIFDKFGLNITNYPTLPSLAFGIFRAHYLKDYKIPLIGGQILKDIREGYFGGHTDMYKPYGENLYLYDVNSLYAAVMSQNPIPIGNITYFEGDILNPELSKAFEQKVDTPIYVGRKTINNLRKPFGFFLCEGGAEAPSPTIDSNGQNNNTNPILLTKAKINGTLRTIAPLGKWTGVIFSEEMYNAQDFGYKFKVLKGYLFESDFIFKDFVNDLYAIKCSHPKDHPMYLISKLLLNSLYGKFGMHIETFLTKNSIVDNSELNDWMENNNVLDILELGDNISLITYIPQNDNDLDSLFNNMTNFNISISISAAITAYARIHMSEFKNPNLTFFNLFYSDTDSIVIDHPLPNDMVSNELGKMKLEKIFKEAVFIGPKVYGGITEDSKETIKAKGYKNKDQFTHEQIKFKTLKSLLTLSENNEINKIELTHEKWFRSFELGEIKIKDQKYTLRPTDNKREFIIKDNKIIGTKPYVINGDTIVKE
jgi:hypothetical protein